MNALTQNFMAHLDTPEGMSKMAAVGQDFLKDKLRENSFMRKVIPPKFVTRADLQASPNHDTLVYLDEVQPNSQAVSLTFRGTPRARYISGERYEIPFFTVASEEFQKTEQELLAYKMPITKIIEDNTVFDIQEIEDYRGLLYVEAMVQATGAIIRGVQARADALANGAGTGFRGTVQRVDLIELFKILAGKRRKLHCFLISDVDALDQLAWTIEDNGDSLQSKIAIDGYPGDQRLGHMMIRTIKTDILQPGNIYGFTKPDMLGKFLILNATKFFIEKKYNVISWMAWEDIGMSFAGIESACKLELYNGQGGGDDSSDPFIAEEDVGAKEYNRVADGIFFPSVSHF